MIPTIIDLVAKTWNQIEVSNAKLPTYIQKLQLSDISLPNHLVEMLLATLVRF